MRKLAGDPTLGTTGQYPVAHSSSDGFDDLIPASLVAISRRRQVS